MRELADTVEIASFDRESELCVGREERIKDPIQCIARGIGECISILFHVR